MNKLSPDQVIDISTDQRPLAEIAVLYAVSSVMVSLIRTGQRYARITGIVLVGDDTPAPEPTPEPIPEPTPTPIAP